MANGTRPLRHRTYRAGRVVVVLYAPLETRRRAEGIKSDPARHVGSRKNGIEIVPFPESKTQAAESIGYRSEGAETLALSIES